MRRGEAKKREIQTASLFSSEKRKYYGYSSPALSPFRKFTLVELLINAKFKSQTFPIQQSPSLTANCTLPDVIPEQNHNP
ncbi:hypothetical protein CEXT_260341 [Caerostris extrusa]|uniref:Uncharacterized protein n=1 Tax=Caerostris extrusa TaxID=172846 RepID=A0AAV4VMP6_CAEEX|nr:hypothetical protein CEXT_260341 [Caerostris extrusa]